MRKLKRPPHRYPLTTAFEGSEIAGSYVNDDGMIKVFYDDLSSDWTQNGRSPAESLAAITLRGAALNVVFAAKGVES
jgi:hypothetical protein